jgi:hypothetical protein
MEVAMATDPHGLDEVLRQALAFLNSDEWQLTQTAERDARNLGYTQVQVAELLLYRLSEGFPFHEVPLGEPPGSGGVGYVLNDVDGQGLYIKFLLEWSYLKIISFHITKHTRSD